MVKWSSKARRPYGNTKPLKSSVLRHHAVAHHRHGCVFPLSLAEELLSVCPARPVIIDSYIGSGTVAVAARSVPESTVYGFDLDCSTVREAVPEATYWTSSLQKDRRAALDGLDARRERHRRSHADNAHRVQRTVAPTRQQDVFRRRKLTLADLLVAPHLDFLAGTPEWQPLTATTPNLVDWLHRMNDRPSFKVTTWQRVAELAKAA